MITVSSESSIQESNFDDTFSQDQFLATKSDKSQQIVLRNPFIVHHPKSGLNPLTDAAAYLFSLAGKLKQLKTYQHLSKLHKELIAEINTFQERAKEHGYGSEYILVSRYALCATLDEIISHTSWGAQGQWDSYNLLTAINQEQTQADRFFIILERIVKDPTLYIDVMELMYICLSLGYKGQYRTTEFSSNQLEQIINSLYKHIRAFRGDFNKTLSPFPIKPVSPLMTASSNIKKMPMWLIILLTSTLILVIFVGFGSLLDKFSNQTYQDLLNIGQASTYEEHDQ